MARPAELFTAFVGNLACSITRAQLLEIFEPHGNLHSVYIRIPEPVATHTFGFIRFTSPESRDAAVEAQNGRSLLGHYISVQKSHQTAQRPTSHGDGINVDAGKRNVREQVDENGAGDMPKLKAMESSIQVRLQQVKDSYSKVLITKYGVHGAAADSMVADFIEHLSRIPYGGVDADDVMVTSRAARHEAGRRCSKLLKSEQGEQQKQQPEPATGCDTCGVVSDVAGLMLPPRLSALAVPYEQPRTPCQQPFALVSAMTTGVPSSGDVRELAGCSAVEAASSMHLKPQLPVRPGPLFGSSGQFEPKGRGKVSLEFLEECTGRGHRHAKV